ncbi:hypothetical protein AVEN_217562-1 [Araneus ventricosus]|uniref:Uncharacterized protein n=1 Tax=Araneus ventricosus TaxID=182803 RepID=A0A4Y2U2W5_ARAVE|nr:hypothetical protein AVEN_63814-1 [Araneus ventricosus]GBO05999.1 hypothetical protein AVEN_217562-1 [Araneus ventricosus]
MCIIVSSIGCGTITKGIKTPVEDVDLDAGESPQRQAIFTCCNMPVTGVRYQCDSLRLSSLLLREGSYPAKLCRVDCMKEDCSHDNLLFVCLCPQRTSERSCIGAVNIAVGHQSSRTTYSLRMSLDLTYKTIPEGQ